MNRAEFEFHPLAPDRRDDLENLFGGRGAEMMEAYPSVIRQEKLPDPFFYMGLPQIYERAGFTTVAEPSSARRIMRCRIAAESGE